jgi:hypothetical protein
MTVHKDASNNTTRDLLQYFSKALFTFKVSCGFTVHTNLFPPIGRTPRSPIYFVTIVTFVAVGAMKAYRGSRYMAPLILSLSTFSLSSSFTLCID